MIANIADTPMLGFDIESTGISVWDDRIVTMALVYVVDGQVTRKYDYLVNPGIDIPEEATAVHGVTTEHAREHGVPPGEAIDNVVGQIALAMHRGIPVVAANASYDFTMLEVEARRHGAPSLVMRRGSSGKVSPVIDPMVLDKQGNAFRKVKGGCKCGCGAEDKTLAGLCLHYGVTLDDAHTADADALAACLLWPKIIEAWPKKLAGYSVDSLHQAQIGWRAEQCDSLRSYFDRTGVEHDGIPTGWPLLAPPKDLVQRLAS